MKKVCQYLIVVIMIFVMWQFPKMVNANSGSVTIGGDTWDIDGSGNVTDSSGNNVGSIASDGTFTNLQGGQANVFDIEGAEINVNLDNGYSVGTTVDYHTAEYQDDMLLAGVAFSEAASNNDQVGMNNAINEANIALRKESGTGHVNSQIGITVENNNGDNTANYGCTNDQPFYITVPNPDIPDTPTIPDIHQDIPDPIHDDPIIPIPDPIPDPIIPIPDPIPDPIIPIPDPTPVPTCTDTSWAPATDTVCSGTSFTQTSNCGSTRTATGTKQPAYKPAQCVYTSTGDSCSDANNCGKTITTKISACKELADNECAQIMRDSNACNPACSDITETCPACYNPWKEVAP